MYRNILVATDGSSIARRAVRHALDLAEAARGQVLALYVVDTRLPSADPESMPAPALELLEQVRRAGVGILRAVVEAGGTRGVPVSYEVLDGTPAEAIVEAAERSRADVVVMGTHGRSGLGSLPVGSTTQAVLHEGRLPVLLVP